MLTGWFSTLRALVYLKRSTIALERIAAALLQELDSRADERRMAEIKRQGRQPLPTEFGLLNVEEVEKRWREMRRERGETVESDYD